MVFEVVVENHLVDKARVSVPVVGGQRLGEGYVELEVGVFGGYLLELVGVEKLFQ